VGGRTSCVRLWERATGECLGRVDGG